MSHKIGQIIYVVSKKETRVIPMQIVEEITKKTLAGSETTYLVSAGKSPDDAMLLDEIDGEIFSSSAECEKSLSQRALRSIQKIITNAVIEAAERFSANDERESSAIVVEPAKTSDEPGDTTEVMMPDGSIVSARIKISQEL